MVHFGNDWDTILDGEFAKTYYQNLRKFLMEEYRNYTIYPGMYDIFNALKYTPAGGRIRIYGDGETLVIADSGIGIREEDQARVFEKGFTGYNGRADKNSSSIGLYLCRQVMDRRNHGISLTSRPGQGTLVRLDLSREWRMVE